MKENNKRQAHRRSVVICLWIVFLFSFAQATRAQYQFDSWTTENGLPQNSVVDILQTRDGYLWLATYGGLVRFDGVQFVVFDRNTEGIIQWSHAYSSVETYARSAARQAVICFNGATLIQAWKPRLLWGYAMELEASMEPRLFKRGNEIQDSREESPHMGFNGATLIQAWKRISR